MPSSLSNPFTWSALQQSLVSLCVCTTDCRYGQFIHHNEPSRLISELLCQLSKLGQTVKPPHVRSSEMNLTDNSLSFFLFFLACSSPTSFFSLYSSHPLTSTDPLLLPLPPEKSRPPKDISQTQHKSYKKTRYKPSYQGWVR